MAGWPIWDLKWGDLGAVGLGYETNRWASGSYKRLKLNSGDEAGAAECL